MIDPSVLTAIITVCGTIITASLAVVFGRGRPGVTVTAAASQTDVANTNSTVASLATTITEQGRQIASLHTRMSAVEDEFDQHEQVYRARIAALELWGATSTEPPPRTVPPWTPPVRAERS